MIRLQAGTYELVEENRSGWNLEAFKERYSDILDKYDYIVGDWGYGQLRLRGFYDNTNRKVPFEQKIATLDEYLQEFCNFGCPYFVIKKVKSAQSHDGSPAPVMHEEAGEAAFGEERQENLNRYDRRPQRPFVPRHERVERSQAAHQEKMNRAAERNEKRPQRNEQQSRERRGPFRPQRDKVSTSGNGDFSKKPQEKRE